ncbi:replication regulatory protein RepA [Salmonella enterica subsp. enterica serovar Potsdam]|uniref:replication regulatory protein RepA n=1 Tax=Salmonella enterica TaxID=28901 RepID=UPI00107AF4A1|nr:replication regulatory protein RepA [Salmonella enterica]EAB6245042.1 replication regulatory protein RepA [Salmonella enterica subsp. enterica serovar Java]EBG5190052.1 replication regulatory protein RepA [Salmonella enterica subsp. enterica serovar Bareilly]EBG8147662.1 replication regulatory protein RepA [Salmonella enterica subsp. enterica serovar Typhimurium]EBK2200919.1 replication regulatory protein RepA [Salmonella enterica subsp. enterica serovar Virchow]EBS3999609.1 transcriptional
MSQTENAVTSSTRKKRQYRKGAPLSPSERKMLSVSRKRETHKPVNVFIRNALKDKLDTLCKEYGLTQSEAIELLLLERGE